MPKQNFFVNEDELDDFQHQLLQKRLDRSMVVSGCAGSGKSILALWKAKQIQELQDSATYKFIVFTVTLQRYMADGIKEIGLSDNNFYYLWDWRKRGKPTADFIIVDEIQDFTKGEIAEFKAAARRAFFFWGDSEQSIYRGMKDTQDILTIAAEAGIQPEQLAFNHRLPKKIARFAAGLVGDDELVTRCRKEGAEKPYILRYKTFEEQLDAAMEQIKNRKITDSGILFLSNDLVKRAYDYLSSKGHLVEAKYKEGKRNHSDLNFTSDNPKLMTYHSAKGLQFEAVFLPECSGSRKNDRAALYVAVTRSYNYLFIMYSTEISRYLDAIPKDLYLTRIEKKRIEL
ncbi:ATP-binding domain-containing protein [Pseudomonadota bacterium]